MNLAVENVENVEKLAEQVRQVAYQLHVYLGNGLLEKVYENGLKHLSPEHLAQTLNYLKITNLPLAVIINFGSYKFETRIVHSPRSPKCAEEACFEGQVAQQRRSRPQGPALTISDSRVERLERVEDIGGLGDTPSSNTSPRSPRSPRLKHPPSTLNPQPPTLNFYTFSTFSKMRRRSSASKGRLRSNGEAARKGPR